MNVIIKVLLITVSMNESSPLRESISDTKLYLECAWQQIIGINSSLDFEYGIEEPLRMLMVFAIPYLYIQQNRS